MTERLGFIGLGAMGRPMAVRLLQADHAICIYARRPETVAALQAAGATVCGSAREVAQHSDVIFVMVTTTADVEQVVTGADGLLHGANAGSLVIVMSTISPLATRELARVLGSRS